MNSRRSATVVLILTTLVYASLAQASRKGRGQLLWFPKQALSDDERIEEVHLSVACGHIEALTSIPRDWHVEVQREISGIEQLHLTAGHGASRLGGFADLDGTIRIEIIESGCFDLSATAIVWKNSSSAREVRFNRTELSLRP